ncbi:MAG: D-glycero-beta-D-manno-heptose 1-phosphate adenylyltransferase [Bdellovibrionaceae bacterium]|nr:D-glycero-beta-D-manno-heptose 1-phosphate adenylyltransferase [Pseudobdellovibrionaceae bacterium]
MGQALSQAELLSTISTVRKNKKVVFTNGCFDILHVGHVRYLQQARQLGDILVVALNSDDSVKRLKGPQRPIQNEKDREEILSSLSCVDYVTIFSEETPLRLITQLQPDVLVKGGDWPVNTIVGFEVVQANGGEVYSLPFVEGRSTTQIIKKSQQ